MNLRDLISIEQSPPNNTSPSELEKLLKNDSKIVFSQMELFN